MRSCKVVFCLSCLFVTLFFCASSQAADGVIEDVKFQGNSDISESVVFYLNGPCLPKAFALKGEKPRIVFDFLDTQLSRTVPSAIPVNGSMVERVRMGRHGENTRVVIDMATMGSFNFEQNFDEKQNKLTIQIYSGDGPVKEEEQVAQVVEPVEAAAAVEPVKPGKSISKSATPRDVRKPVTVATDVAASPFTPEPLLSDVSFENTSNKGEMVLFKLNGFYPPVVSGEEQGTPKVTCVFAGTRLGEDVVQEQSVRGKFVNKVSVSQAGDSGQIRVVLELVPSKNYDLQQVFFKEDNLFVIIVNSYDAVTASSGQ